MSTLETNLIQPATGTALTVGASGDTITVPSGATFNVAGTLQSGGNAVANTPAFSTYINANQTLTDNTDTKANYDTEAYDTNSAYDVSNKRFTVPSGEDGKYFFYARGRFYNNSDHTSQFVIAIRKNNSEIAKRYIYSGGTTTKIFYSVYYYSYDISCNVVLSAGDYIEVFVKADDVSGNTIEYQGGTVHSEFSGFKLLGV